MGKKRAKYTDTQKKIVEFFDRARDTCLRKNRDYGDSVFKPCELAGLDSGQAILVRMTDKIARLTNLLGKGRANQVKDESAKDTMMDLGVYCFLWCIDLEQKK